MEKSKFQSHLAAFTIITTSLRFNELKGAHCSCQALMNGGKYPFGKPFKTFQVNMRGWLQVGPRQETNHVFSISHHLYNVLSISLRLYNVYSISNHLYNVLSISHHLYNVLSISYHLYNVLSISHHLYNVLSISHHSYNVLSISHH